MKSLKAFITSIKYNLFAVILFITAWIILSLFFEPYIIPSPAEVISNSGKYLTADFLKNFNITFFRVIIGFSVSIVFGIVLGITTFKFRIEPAMNTLLILVQVIPGIVIGIIFLILFGLGSSVPILLIIVFSLPVISINTSNALFKRNKAMEELVRSYGGNSADIIKSVHLPALIPVIKTNLTFGFGMALKVVVLGEFIGSQDGMGYLLNVARIYFNMAEVFFYLALIIFLMFIFQIIVDFIFDFYLIKYSYQD